jgi:rod shape-determining protein MreD
MRHVIQGFFGIVLAVVLHTILGKVSPNLLTLLNVFSWVVLYFSLTRHEVFGALMGTACGLIQDSLSLGVFGVGGLTKTLLGFGAGFISRKINITPVFRTFVFALIMAALELSLWKSLVLFLFGERFSTARGIVFLQPLFTALLVTVSFHVNKRAEARGS